VYRTLIVVQLYVHPEASWLYDGCLQCWFCRSMRLYIALKWHTHCYGFIHWHMRVCQKRKTHNSSRRWYTQFTIWYHVQNKQGTL